MTASNQPSALNIQLAKALMARESVQIMAEEISSLFLCRVRLPKNLSKPVIGRQGIAHMPRGSLGMVQPEIAHVLFIDIVTRFWAYLNFPFPGLITGFAF